VKDEGSSFRQGSYTRGKYEKILILSICCLFSLQAIAQNQPPPPTGAQPAKSSETKAAATKSAKKTDDLALYRRSGNRNEAWNEIVEEGLRALMDENLATGIVFLERAVNAGLQGTALSISSSVSITNLRGDYVKAIDFYKTAGTNIFRQYPKTPYAADIHESYGRALFTMGKFAEAKVELEAAVSQNSKSFTPFFLLAQIYKSEGSTQQAIDYLLMAKTLPFPTDTANNIALSIAIELAQGYYQLGDTDNAPCLFKEP
jgi:tetratricopeptide (TPR) repeat protein